MEKSYELNTAQALVELSNNDAKLEARFTEVGIVLGKIGGRLEYLSRVIDNLFVSEEVKPMTTLPLEDYKAICTTILEKMIDEKKQALSDS